MKRLLHHVSYDFLLTMIGMSLATFSLFYAMHEDAFSVDEFFLTTIWSRPSDEQLNKSRYLKDLIAAETEGETVNAVVAKDNLGQQSDSGILYIFSLDVSGSMTKKRFIREMRT